MRLAQTAYDDGNFERTQQILSSFLPEFGTSPDDDPREYFWEYLWTLVNDQQFGFVGRPGCRFSDLVLSKGGRILTGKNCAGEVTRWSLATRGQVSFWRWGPATSYTYPVAEPAERYVDLSPDGHTVASRDRDNEVVIRDLTTGKTLSVLKPGVAVLYMQFLALGTRMVTAGADGVVHLWEMPSGKPLYTWMVPGFQTLREITVSLSGNAVAATYNHGPTVVWDTMGGGELGRPACEGGYETLFLSPDGRTLACHETQPGYPVLFDVGGAPNRRVAQFTNTSGLVFTPDSRLMANLLVKRMIALQDVRTGKVRQPVLDEADLPIAFSEDGKMMATGGDQNTIRLWDVGSGRPLQQPFKGHMGAISKILFALDGRELISGANDGTVRVWRVGRPPSRETSARITVPGKLVTSESFLGEDAAAAKIGENRAAAWGRIHAGPAPVELTDAADTGAIALSGNGALLARYLSQRGVVAVRNIRENRDVRQFKPTGIVISLTLSDDGGTMAWLEQQPGSIETTPKAFRTQTGEALSTALTFSDVGILGLGDPWNAIAVSGDGNTVAARTVAGFITAWTYQGTTASESSFQVRSERQRRFSSVALSWDGRLLAAGEPPRAVTVWDLRTRQEMVTLARFAEPVVSVHFSSNGLRLLGLSANGTIRGWGAFK
jgi:WD40 repeat protein